MPGHLQALVVEDTVLWLRTLFLYAVAQAAVDVAEGAFDPVISGGLGRLEVTFNAVPASGLASVPPSGPSDSASDETLLPEGLTNAVSLAKWALQQAAKRLARR